MGSFPHEFRVIAMCRMNGAALVRRAWGVSLQNEPGLRIPNMFEPPSTVSQGLYIEGEDIAQSDPNTQHVTRPDLNGMHHRAGPVPERVGEVAHVFCRDLVPGKTARSRMPSGVSHACASDEAEVGYADWEITQLLAMLSVTR